MRTNTALLQDIHQDQADLIAAAKRVFGSHAAVAMALGLSRQSYQRYVSGDRLMSLYYYYTLSDIAADNPGSLL